MTAELPKRTRLILFLLSFVMCGIVAFGQDEPILPTATNPLDGFIERIETLTVLSEDQKTALIDAAAIIVDDVSLTADDATMLLDRLGLDQLVEGEDPQPLVDSLLTVLSEIGAEGGLDLREALLRLDELIAAQSELETATPEGIRNAISNAAVNYSGDLGALLAQVEGLIFEGVPPGIVLRVVKEGLRSGEEIDIGAWLTDLGTAILVDGLSPGLAANAITGKGQSKHQEQELNQNANRGKNDEPENESEQNKNNSPGDGNARGNSRNDNKGQAKKN